VANGSRPADSPHTLQRRIGLERLSVPQVVVTSAHESPLRIIVAAAVRPTCRLDGLHKAGCGAQKRGPSIAEVPAGRKGRRGSGLHTEGARGTLLSQDAPGLLYGTEHAFRIILTGLNGHVTVVEPFLRTDTGRHENAYAASTLT